MVSCYEKTSNWHIMSTDIKYISKFDEWVTLSLFNEYLIFLSNHLCILGEALRSTANNYASLSAEVKLCLIGSCTLSMYFPSHLYSHTSLTQYLQMTLILSF